MVSKYKVWQTEIFVILGHFLSFQTPDNPKNQNFKIEKNTWRYYHFPHLHHKSWCMVPEIWSTTDRIFCHSGPFFCPFTPLQTQKIKILKKWNVCLKILPFYKSTKNHDHMLYCSSDMALDGCNCYFSFWAIFCPPPCPPSPLLTAQKIKTSKKWEKKHLEISSFYTCTKNYD